MPEFTLSHEFIILGLTGMEQSQQQSFNDVFQYRGPIGSIIL